MIAEVIVDVAHSDVDKIFDYLCGDEVAAGMRVTVPFGARTETGFVMRVKEETEVPPGRLKPIFRVEDELPAINGECLSLARKISERYRCPMALSLRLFLPAEMRTGKAQKTYREYMRLAEDIPPVSPKAKTQLACIAYLGERGEVPADELRKTFKSAVTALKHAGAIRSERRRVMRRPYTDVPAPKEEHILTPAQRRAVGTVKETKRTVCLLHGVTGSGKTEVYLTLIADALKEGKSAIFLVPEISLTPQMFSKLRSRFREKVAILHSGLSAGERFDEWERLRMGEAKIAVGARSAVFAPLENIGLIVIDEEHDGSYSSEQTPRYNTFDIAYLRARHNGCKLLLGSATPSVETYRRAAEGEFELIGMPDRINQRPMPKVRLVDMRREVRRGNPTPFSLLLREKLAECLKKGNQAILFLNRRGYSQTVMCRDCGHVVKCESCDVALTYHSDEDCLKCHYCGAKYRPLSACPACGGKHIHYMGTGTQRVVGELKKLLPSARILRMDVDTTSGKEGHYKILKQFADRKADILVGTQMVAKGHDFPFVTLVGILDADMSLHFPDYRSGERTFQLITQVAGRSGRAGEEGEVVLQTYDPENYILRFAAEYDYKGFYEHEISVRSAMMYPPFVKIVRVMATGEDEQETLAALRSVYERLKAIYAAHEEQFLFFNRMHSPIKRIQNRFRYQILMRMTTDGPLREIYAAVSGEKYKNVLVYVEENPSNLS